AICKTALKMVALRAMGLASGFGFGFRRIGAPVARIITHNENVSCYTSSGGEMNNKIREIIDAGPMSRFQVLAVAICVGLNMLDGFDVLVMAFTGPAISADWGLKGAQLGVLLSAGLFGMAGGSLFLAPWADR